MAYIGAPPPDRILTTEDIEDGAVEMSDISWKNQSANENLSGTIDSFTVKLAEKFTLTGDIDISKDLVLIKLADDGEALVLTTDGSSRTIEGSGTISSNTFAQVPNASLTGMTGEISSSVLSKATFEGTLNSSTTFSGDAGKMTAKAWCNFYGSGTPGIRTSFNVSSLTDVDVGRWEVNYITSPAPFPAAVSAQGGSVVHVMVVNEDQNAGAGKCEIGNYRWDTGAYNDTAHIYVVVFGD